MFCEILNKQTLRVHISQLHGDIRGLTLVNITSVDNENGFVKKFDFPLRTENQIEMVEGFQINNIEVKKAAHFFNIFQGLPAPGEKRFTNQTIPRNLLKYQGFNLFLIARYLP